MISLKYATGEDIEFGDLVTDGVNTGTVSDVGKNCHGTTVITVGGRMSCDVNSVALISRKITEPTLREFAEDILEHYGRCEFSGAVLGSDDCSSCSKCMADIFDWAHEMYEQVWGDNANN
jgi:hypothetical protein